MFHWDSIEEIQHEAILNNLFLPFSQELSTLGEAVTVKRTVLPNRIAIQPMEGCDGTKDGSPDELTLYRYKRFAHSGAGLIWAEATAVLEEGRANPRQLWIREENAEDFRRMNDMIRSEADTFSPVIPKIIMQATHSGRYSKPKGVPAPLIAENKPVFEGDSPIPGDRIVSDEYLDRLVERMGEAARLAQKAGFDGIDIKACHGYLSCELLSAYDRPGRYGGSFENRTRFLREAVAAAKAAVTGDFIVTSRLNVYDGFPYPYGFGVKEGGGLAPDLEEAVRLVGILHKELGMGLLDVTIGNPYANPHVNRPADVVVGKLTGDGAAPQQSGGSIDAPDPAENPLVGVARMLSCIRTIQQAYPDLAVVGSGLSYLRRFSPYLAAGAVEQGYFTIAGFGRLAFAYPNFARDMLSPSGMDRKQFCVACGGCTKLMRNGYPAGCAVRTPVYQQFMGQCVREEKKKKKK